MCFICLILLCFFFQAEDGIRDLVRSRGLGDVYKRQVKGTIRLTLTDVTGRVIYSTEYSDVRQGQVYAVNTLDFSEGLYLLNIVTSGERIAKKFIIQH